MSSFVVVKTALAPVRWLLRYILRGLTAIGLSSVVIRIPDDEEIAESEALADDPRGFPLSGHQPAPGPSGASAVPCFADIVSTVELTADERLWEAELREDDTAL